MKAPPLGVTVISQLNGYGKKCLLHGEDYYWWVKDEGFWEGSDHFGMMEMMIYNLDNVGKVMCGRMLHTRQWEKILKRASEENK